MNPSKRRTVIAGNWKMNFTPAEATAFINEIKPMVAGKDKCDIIFCAPYVTISAAMAAAEGSNIKIGAENGLAADLACNEGGGFLHSRLGCGGGHVHLPVACDDGFSCSLVHWCSLRFKNSWYKSIPEGQRHSGTQIVRNYLSCRQAIPGSSSPSRNSRDAPPPVEMWVIFSA